MACPFPHPPRPLPSAVSMSRARARREEGDAHRLGCHLKSTFVAAFTNARVHLGMGRASRQPRNLHTRDRIYHESTSALLDTTRPTSARYESLSKAGEGLVGFFASKGSQMRQQARSSCALQSPASVCNHGNPRATPNLGSSTGRGAGPSMGRF